MCIHVIAVDCCNPGDLVTITAIVKATSLDVGHSGHSSKDHCTFCLHLHAISISNDKLLEGVSHMLLLTLDSLLRYSI